MANNISVLSSEFSFEFKVFNGLVFLSEIYEHSSCRTEDKT